MGRQRRAVRWYNYISRHDHASQDTMVVDLLDLVGPQKTFLCHKAPPGDEFTSRRTPLSTSETVQR